MNKWYETKCFYPLCKRLNDEYTEISHIFCVSKMALKWTMRCMWLHQLFPFFGSWFMDPPKEHPKYPKMPKMSILDFCWKVFLLAKCLEICNYAKVKGMKLKQIWKFPSPPFTTLGIMLWIFNWPRVHKISRKVAFISLFVVLEGFT